MSDTTLFAIGERNGKVVIMFQGAVTELVLDPENARQAAEQLARSAYHAHFGVVVPATQSMVSEIMRKKLHARALLIIRSLMDQHKRPAVIANRVVDELLKEVT